jgi:hypothetical protein
MKIGNIRICIATVAITTIALAGLFTGHDGVHLMICTSLIALLNGVDITEIIKALKNIKTEDKDTK